MPDEVREVEFLDLRLGPACLQARDVEQAVEQVLECVHAVIQKDQRVPALLTLDGSRYRLKEEEHALHRLAQVVGCGGQEL